MNTYFFVAETIGGGIKYSDLVYNKSPGGALSAAEDMARHNLNVENFTIIRFELLPKE